jgi:hypothetical protein
MPIRMPDGVIVTAGALWCLLAFPQVAKYTTETLKNKLPKIPVVHLNAVSDYIRGRTQTCQFLTVTPTVARAKRRTPSEMTVADAIADEIPLQTRASAMHVSGSSFNTARKSVFEKAIVLDLGVPIAPAVAASIKAAHNAASSATAVPAATGAAAAAGSKKSASLSSSSSSAPAAAAAAAPEARIPIIVVPSARTAMLNLTNALAFFSQGTYTPPTAAGAGTHLVRFTRTNAAGRKREFHLVDNPERLSDSEWQRVVAVVVTGQSWQLDFKRGSPADIFSHAIGVYPQWDNDAPHDNIAKWGVKRLMLSRTNRHRDGAIAAEFWRMLSAFLSTRPNAASLAY